MKSHCISRYMYVCASLSLIYAFAAFTACTKKESSFRAITTFVIGTANIERAGETMRPLRHKEELKAGDVITTGPDSLVVIQMGQDSLIKIESSTTLSMAVFTEKGDTKLNLDKGRMFTRLHHLSKEATFTVYTKTSLAAVRGTEFSVTSDKNESIVAVNDGSVAVQKVAADDTMKEEKTIEKGNAAVVNKTIKTRPVSADEKKEFNRFEKIAAVSDIDNKSESDLKQMEDEYLKSKDTIKDTDKKEESEKEKDKDKKKEKTEDKTAVKEDKPADDDITKKATLWTSKKVFTPGDTIIVYYKDMPQYRNCWIDISKAEDAEGRYQSYYWTYSAKDGQMTFAGLNLKPGLYEARAHFGKSSSVNKRFRFEVK